MENQTLKNTIIITISALVFLTIVNFFDISYPIKIQSLASQMDLSVVGEGKIEVKPDTARVQIGISARSLPSVAEVEKKINETNNALVKEMQTLGIKPEDMSTSNYSINPDYSYTPDGKANTTGYSGNATLSLKIRDLTLVAKAINLATNVGASNIEGTSYFVDKPEVAREQARDLAINNAKQQAEKLAQKLGIRLGKITNLVESSGGGDYPPMMYKTMALPVSGGGGATEDAALQAGTQTITSTVTLYFEKK